MDCYLQNWINRQTVTYKIGSVDRLVDIQNICVNKLGYLVIRSLGHLIRRYICTNSNFISDQDMYCYLSWTRLSKVLLLTSQQRNWLSMGICIPNQFPVATQLIKQLATIFFVNRTPGQQTYYLITRGKYPTTTTPGLCFPKKHLSSTKVYLSIRWPLGNKSHH